MDGKVFEKDTKNKAVKFIDQCVKLPWYAEPFDGPAISLMINIAEEKADKFIPDRIDPLLNRGLSLALDGEYEEASENLGKAISDVINIPNIEEDKEKELCKTGVLFVLRYIDDKIDKSKE